MELQPGLPKAEYEELRRKLEERLCWLSQPVYDLLIYEDGTFSPPKCDRPPDPSVKLVYIPRSTPLQSFALLHIEHYCWLPRDVLMAQTPQGNLLISTAEFESFMKQVGDVVSMESSGKNLVVSTTTSVLRAKEALESQLWRIDLSPNLEQYECKRVQQMVEKLVRSMSSRDTEMAGTGFAPSQASCVQLLHSFCGPIEPPGLLIRIYHDNIDHVRKNLIAGTPRLYRLREIKPAYVSLKPGEYEAAVKAMVS